MKQSTEKKILRRLNTYTELVLWMHGEHPHLTPGQVRSKIAMVTTTIAVAKAMLNDDPTPPPTTTETAEAADERQTKIPF